MGLQQQAQQFVHLTVFINDYSDHFRELADSRWDQLLNVSNSFETVARMASQTAHAFYQQCVKGFWEGNNCVIPDEVLEEFYVEFQNNKAADFLLL